jgi:hypothetical protein
MKPIFTEEKILGMHDIVVTDLNSEHFGLTDLSFFLDIDHPEIAKNIATKKLREQDISYTNYPQPDIIDCDEVYPRHTEMTNDGRFISSYIDWRRIQEKYGKF